MVGWCNPGGCLQCENEQRLYWPLWQPLECEEGHQKQLACHDALKDARRRTFIGCPIPGKAKYCQVSSDTRQ
jgi:hypothetical protein